MKTISGERRTKILDYASTHGVAAAARKFGVYGNTIYRWRRIEAKRKPRVDVQLSRATAAYFPPAPKPNNLAQEAIDTGTDVRILVLTEQVRALKMTIADMYLEQRKRNGG